MTRLVRGIPGLVAKDGAEGVYVAALPDGRAAAVKIADGSERARTAVLAALLHRLGVEAPVLDELADVPVLGHGVPGRARRGDGVLTCVLVVQRVTRARVVVDGEVVGAIERPGLVALVGATHDDTAAGADGPGAQGRRPADPARRAERARRSGPPVLVVSQFTLYADTRKGRRPSWSAAAPGPVAEPLVEAFAAALRGAGLEVATGRFGADMAVELVNDGPVTLILEV